MQDFETECKVANVYNGYAHIVEQTYDDSFKFWYGCVGVTCTNEEAHILASEQHVQIQLPDRRSMTVHLLQTQLHDRPSPQGAAARMGFGFYFISTTPLVNVASLFPGFIECCPPDLSQDDNAILHGSLARSTSGRHRLLRWLNSQSDRPAAVAKTT